MCPADGQQNDDKKSRRGVSQVEGKVKKPKTNRPQQGGGFSFNLCLPGVLALSGVTSHDISR